MKTRAAVTLCLVLAGAVPRAGALDFVVQATSVVEDGFTREQLYVRNDERTNVWLNLPAGWLRTDGPTSLTLTPPDLRNSLVRVDKSPLGPTTEFREAGLDAYRRRVVADIPPGATNVQCREERVDPLPIFGWKDHEFVYSYEFFGQTYRRSVVFVNLNSREQLMLTCVAPTENFDAVHNAGLDVLRSWQVMPAN